MSPTAEPRRFATAGDRLAVQDWPLQAGQPLRGVVVAVHGLGEHAGRYETLANRLNSWGFAVRAYDQYGHGESGGARGGLPSDNQLVEDLADILSGTRKHMAAGTPLILLGHSMGGLVASRVVGMGLASVDALVLSSPAFDVGLSLWHRLLLDVLPSIAPDLRLGNGVNPKWLSHDPGVVQAYRSDPLVHDRISARLARFIVEGGVETLGQAGKWQVPTLLLYAGEDRLVHPRGSRAFAKAAPPRVVTAHCFEHLYHEIFNEMEVEPVYAKLREWLDRWF